LGDGDEGADVVEEIDEEKDEDDFEEADMEGSWDIEMEGCGFNGGEVVRSGLPVDLMEDDSEECCGEDADENRGSHAKDLQDRNDKEADDGEDGCGSVKVSEGDGGCGAGDDDAGVAESDEGDEEADASADGCMELVRDGCDEALADASYSENEEDDAGEKDGSEGGLPGDAHAFDDGVGEVGIEAHAGSEGEWVVGGCSHENAAEGRAEAGCGGDGGEWHAGFGEDGRVDEDDVGHRDEGGESGEDFGAPVGGVGGEGEVLLEIVDEGAIWRFDGWVVHGICNGGY
jgi:hypothetical protein